MATAWLETCAWSRMRTTASASLTHPSTAPTALVSPTMDPSAPTRRSAATQDPSAEGGRIDSVLSLQHPIAPFPRATLPSRLRRDLLRQLLISSANTADIAVPIAIVLLGTNALYRIRTTLNASPIHLSTKQATRVYPTMGTGVTIVAYAAIPGRCVTMTRITANVCSPANQVA